MIQIYFAGSIRGGRDDQHLYGQIIQHLAQNAKVLTEHVGDGQLALQGEDGRSDRYIWKRDLDWLRQADAVIAELTRPSHGVGYEIAKAEEWGKPILGIWRPEVNPNLSAMIAGSSYLYLELQPYRDLESLKPIVDKFLLPVRLEAEAYKSNYSYNTTPY